MIRGQIPIVFLIMLHGVHCMFSFSCSKEPCQCGDNMTVTCTSNEPLTRIEIIDRNEKNRMFVVNYTDNRTPLILDKRLSVAWIDKKEVNVTISKVTFSDEDMYILHLRDGIVNPQGYIPISVSGVCDPEVSYDIEIKELECKVESKKGGSIVWMDKDRKVYPETRTWKPEQGAKWINLKSSLKLMEEMENDDIMCCYGSYPDEKCSPNGLNLQSSRGTQKSNDRNTIGLTIMAVALCAAAVGVAFHYLLKRRRRSREVPEEQNTEEPQLLAPEMV